MSIFWIAIILFIAFNIFLVFFIIFSRRKKKLSSRDQKYFQEHWENIIQLSQNDPKHAILEADKILDKALQKKGYSGHLGEKLKKSGSLFRNLNDVWYAHKKRNQIAHELNFQVSPAEGQNVLRIFSQALRDLGIKL